MIKITQEELNIKLALHRKWRRGEEGGARLVMSGCDMSGYDMSGCNMTGCDMRGCNMTGCDMRGCNMTGCDMRGCIMTGCDMRGCNMTGCNMRGCDMRGCDMRGCNMRGCDMSGCNMRGCDMSGSDMRGCKYLDIVLNENDKIISMSGLEYYILFVKNYIKIGCKEYKREEWASFTDIEILEMDGQKGLDFWNKNKEWILTFNKENV